MRVDTHMDVDEAVNVAQVLAQGHLVLLLRLVHIAIQHLQHGVLAVHVALMALGNDLHVLPDLLQLAWTDTQRQAKAKQSCRSTAIAPLSRMAPQCLRCSIVCTTSTRTLASRMIFSQAFWTFRRLARDSSISRLSCC